MKNKQNISLGKVGMNKDSHPKDLDEKEYSHAKNINFENESGDSFNITNEPSNILANKFKEGFKVIHAVNDIDTTNTYFFLTNPETGEGEFGVVENNQDTNDLEDLTLDCEDCSAIRELAEPLENLEQVSLQNYTTLISDSCKEDKTEGFNFNILNPIKKSVIKNEKCGKTIYFSQKGNPPRYINIDKISDYFIQTVPCGEDIVLECPDFSKMRIFKLFDIPELLPVNISLGGNLRKGVYEFLIAYCDAEGREISEYFSITNPIAIFDKNNLIMSQPEIADRTNFAINLEVSGLDLNYTHYKIAVIQTADIDGASRVYIEGVHTINDTTVTYSTEYLKEVSTFDALARVYQKVEESEGVATANNILYQYGITNKKEINLQPVVNLLGELALKWQTHVANEDIYDNGVLSSQYLGYSRDEVIPLAIKFGFKGGYETVNFPLIGRLPKEGEEEEVEETNLDRVSIQENLKDCYGSNRTKVWQYYNTATVDEEQCFSEGVIYKEVTETLSKTCTINDIASVSAGTLTVEINEEFNDLEDYLNNNIGNSEAECDTIFPDNPEICDVFYADYSAISCIEDPFEGLDCTTPTEISNSILVQSIAGQGENGKEVVTYNEKIFPTEYSKIVEPKYCYMYLIGSDGKPEQDEDNLLGVTPLLGNPIALYVRDSNFSNEDCTNALDIPFITTATTNTQETSFNNYYVDTVLANLLTSKTSSVTSSDFNSNIHKGALWFKLDMESNEKMVVDVSRQNKIIKNDKLDSTQEVRVSVFKKCSDTVAIFSKIISLTDGDFYLFEKQGLNLKITDGAGTVSTIVNGWDSDKNFLISVEAPIFLRTVNINPSGEEDRYIVAPSDGCYTVTKRVVENKSITFEWDSITLKKQIELEATCTFNVPVVQSCKAVPFKKGDFAFWESEQTYPDNIELYDSSSLQIEEEDIPLSLKEKFESSFADLIEGNYVWKEDVNNKPLVDFTCRNIRHFKMPDNVVAPFMDDTPQPSFYKNLIYPLGITINEETINVLLDIAEKNNLISKEDRQNIVYYEIVRGDLTLNRSVIASGMLFDMRQYEEKGKKILYSNYPFNSYSADKFNLDENNDFITFDDLGERNNHYTFHSPETDYYRPNIPTELSIQGYLQGKARLNFNEVNKHPKYVLLTNKARSLASTLATLEVVAEAVIASAQALSNFNPIAGFSTTIFPGGAVASGIIAGFSALTSAVFKYGRYRYQWLEVFQNLGTPHNFTYYSYGEGYYNYLNLDYLEENRLRGINTSKYLNADIHFVTNEVTAEIININNQKRENSLYLSLGDSYIEYPDTYKNYDRNSSNASLTFMGENGIKETGKSSDIIRNVASPYVNLKNYLPSQHGTVNSVKWLPTGYRGDLTNPRTDCLPIFGGDTFISRHTVKRHHSQFLTDVVKEADRTPWNYFFYNNIGRNPRFYLSVGVDKDFSGGGKIFPDIENDFRLDNLTSKSNYYTPPSKFYLDYFGVPNFLCETRINTNFRYAGNKREEWFYPQASLDLITQRTDVDINSREQFFYNKSYSKQVTPLKQRMLASNYSKDFNDCKTDFPNGIIASLPDNSENNSYDPWLIYRPLDFFEFPSSFGKLRDVQGIENEAILTRFENTSILFNKVDTTIDDGQNPNKPFLGGSTVFQRRTASFHNAQLGFGGTQNTASVSCEFGHFHVDAKRGQVLQTNPSGGEMQEISSIINGKPSGMRNWFKEHLPFKILKYFKDVDTDNNYNGVGITMVWDSRFRRVLITKKDYIPLNNSITHNNGNFYLGLTKIELDNSLYFKDVSFTVAYSPVLGSWMSFYDFKPNYYIAHNNYFQSGVNKYGEEFGLWSHLLTNKSYQVFYGSKFPSEIELPVKFEYMVKKLSAVNLWTEARRYHNKYDYVIDNQTTFNKSVIYGNQSCSGYLNLIPQKNNLAENRKYPKTNNDNTQDILITNKDNYEWSYNYFYDRIRQNTKNVPFRNWDDNQINMTLDNSVITFTGNKILKRLDGDWFLNRLTYDKDSRYQIIFKFLSTEF